MGPWINFAEIRQKVTLEDVLFKFYRLPLKLEGGSIVAACPIHGGDNPRAWNANLAKNLWHCFTRCGGGNQIDFVAKKENISVRDAGLKLHTFFLLDRLQETRAASSIENSGKESIAHAIPQAQAGGTATKEARAPEKNPPLKVQLELNPDHPHLLEERGLKAETIARFGVGYCGRGTLRGLIAIPIHDAEGVLVAFAGRRLKEEAIEKHGKYVFPKGFRKELVLYNYDRSKAVMATEGLVLVEGFFAVLKLAEAGLANVVAVMGSELSDQQTELAAIAPDVIVLFDGDEAGRKGSAHAAAKLSLRTKVRVIRLPEGMKPDMLPAKALRWAVNGVRALDLSELSFSLHANQESKK